jgi:hypothetical protein
MTPYAAIAGSPGRVALYSTLSSAYCRWMTATNAILLEGGESTKIRFGRRTSSANFGALLGFHDITTYAAPASLLPVDGVCFHINNLTLQGVVSSNSSRDTTAGNYTLTASEWYEAGLEIAVDLASVHFWLNDADGNRLWEEILNTTKIPIATGRETGHGVIAAGYTAYLDIDYMEFQLPVTRD